jgi:hypothetical protein
MTLGNDALPAWKVGAAGFFAAILAFLSYPLDLRYWNTYGAYFTEIFVDNISFLRIDPCIRLAHDTMGIILVFHELSKWIYQLPILFIGMSALLKTLEVVILYLIFKRFRFSPRAALLFAVIVVLLVGLDGTAPNGIFGPPDYNKAFVSALMSLLGIYFLIGEKAGWAGLLFGGACYFHIPYGLTAAAFAGAGQFAHCWSERRYRPLLRLAGVCAVTLVPLVIQVAGVGRLVEAPMGMDAWYRHLMRGGIWGNDTLLLSSLFSDAFLFAVPTVVYFLMRSKNPVSKLLDSYVRAGFVLAGLCLAIEGLHAQGIFLGRISDIFISIQMRRGAWIPYFMIAVGCLGFLWEAAEERRFSWRWVLAAWTLLFLLRPTYVVGLLIALTIAGYVWQQRRSWLWYLSPFAIVVCLGMRVYFLSEANAFSVSLVNTILFPLAIALIAAAMPLLLGSAGTPTRIGLVALLLVGPLIGREIPNWYRDVQWLTARGWFSPIGSFDLLAQLQSREGTKPSVIERPEYAVLEELRRINPRHDLVFYPYSLGILEGHVPGMLGPYWCYIQATHSYAAASIISNLAETTYGRPIDPQDLFTPRMEEIHASIPAERIKTLFAEGRMTWFISTRLYPELSLERRVGEYYIYRKPL